MSETPDPTPDSTLGSTVDPTPVTGIEESDPNADSAEGLAGDLGVSSERRGPVRGQGEEVTYGAAPTHDDANSEDSEDAPPEDALPEQSAFDGQPDANPDSPGRHESDPDSNPRHGV